MKCPIDGVDLVMTERQGVEIDYCPKCRGVWLDRGELDKIIERVAGEDLPPARPTAPPAPAYQAPAPQAPPPAYVKVDDDDDRYRHDPYRKKKKKSFFDDLFDF